MVLSVAWWAVAASSVYLGTLSLGGATRIEYRPWRWNRCRSWSPAAIPAVVVMAVAVANSAVSWYFSVAWVGCGGPSSVYLSTLSLCGDARSNIDRGRWNRCCSWSCCVISAVVVVVVAVADSAVSWYFRWPGRAVAALSVWFEHAESSVDARIEYRPWRWNRYCSWSPAV